MSNMLDLIRVCEIVQDAAPDGVHVLQVNKTVYHDYKVRLQDGPNHYIIEINFAESEESIRQKIANITKE